MPRKKTDTEFKREVYDLVGNEYRALEEYDGAFTHIKFRHEECGTIIEATPTQFLGGRVCRECYPTKTRKIRKWTQEMFEGLVYKDTKGEYIVKGKIVNSTILVEMGHVKCGNVWKVRPSQFIDGGTRCPECARYIRGDKFRKTQEEFEQEVRETIGDEYKVIGEYEGSQVRIEMEHQKCGYVWETNPNSILAGKSGCPKCWAKRQGDMMRKTHEEYVQEVYNLLGDEYTLLGLYTGSMDKIEIRHNKCGYEWEVRAKSVISNEGGCHKCKESRGERRVRRYLESIGVEVKGEVMFEDLKHINHLRYDFGVYDKNGDLKGLIEYDGKQHYQVIKLYGEQAYKDIKIRDKIKNKYAVKNVIPLLRIPYTDIDNIEGIVGDFLQEIELYGEELN